jgi:hypothetical protein
MAAQETLAPFPLIRGRVPPPRPQESAERSKFFEHLPCPARNGRKRWPHGFPSRKMIKIYNEEQNEANH